MPSENSDDLFMDTSTANTHDESKTLRFMIWLLDCGCQMIRLSDLTKPEKQKWAPDVGKSIEKVS